MKKLLLVLLLCIMIFPVKAKELYEYRINYYYDGTLEESVIKREELSNIIKSFDLKPKENYILESSTIDSDGLVISSDINKNIIDVYYSSEDVEAVIDIIDESNNKNMIDNFIKNLSNLLKYIINLIK